MENARRHRTIGSSERPRDQPRPASAETAHPCKRPSFAGVRCPVPHRPGKSLDAPLQGYLERSAEYEVPRFATCRTRSSRPPSGIGRRSSASALRLQNLHDFVQLVGQLTRHPFAEAIGKAAIVPKRFVSGLTEAGPDFFANLGLSQITEDRTRVVDLVGQ